MQYCGTVQFRFFVSSKGWLISHSGVGCMSATANELKWPTLW